MHRNSNGDAYWPAYDVAFAMAEEWLSLGVSAMLVGATRPPSERWVARVRRLLVDPGTRRRKAWLDVGMQMRHEVAENLVVDLIRGMDPLECRDRSVRTSPARAVRVTGATG